MIQLKGWTRNTLFIVGLLFIIFLLWYFSAIVTYILISVVLSFIGRPLTRWLTKIKYKRFKIPKGLAAFATLVSLWIVFISFFRFIIPLLLSEVETLSQIDFTLVLDSIEDPLLNLLHIFHKDAVSIESKNFMDIVTENLGAEIDFSQVSNWFGLVAGTVGELLIGFFSVSFITFFFLKEETMFRTFIILLVPTHLEEKVAHILDSIAYLLRRYFIGLLLEVFMVMLLDTIGLTIVGIEFNHAVVIGLFCGMFNVIPYLGPWMGAALGLLIGAALHINLDFMNEVLPVLGWMTLVFLSVQVIDNVLFQPLIYSSSVKAHPLEIFLVIMAAGSMAGIIGMILAIPVYTIIRVIAAEFFENMKLVKKLTEHLEKEKVKD
ncbi:AI-2E family transporter [Draconibacterium sp. IB214405]|uniref:AI-2E family transporter n=1 Tax=Draconibacterium sp. IB214405 TaxID=3097352 RepID=UPI002A13F0B7|nr:AI-2E family transporter [Draconibacterium sp. IB214405]MDX8341471.1 AI-2E family transporter [Draconibacterium sp. IB214405]